jgi:hypothetical protein
MSREGKDMSQKGTSSSQMVFERNKDREQGGRNLP